jgi:hypothetical protein
MRIGFDIDGIGFTFGDSCKKHLDHTGRGHLWKSGPTPDPYWDWYKDWGWTSQEFVDFCNEAADCGCLFSGPVREGYKEAIDAVANMGHEIIVATDRTFGATPSVSENITINWFIEHEMNYDELHFTADKTSANCDFFIEDKLENYDALILAGVKAYLLNRPWNQVPGGDGRNRINDISEYVDAVAEATQKGYADLVFA